MKKFVPFSILLLVLLIGTIAFAADLCPANCEGSGCSSYVDGNKSGMCDLAVGDASTKPTEEKTSQLCAANCKGSGCENYVDENKNGMCDLAVEDVATKPAEEKTSQLCPANCKGSGCENYVDENKNGMCDLAVEDTATKSAEEKTSQLCPANCKGSGCENYVDENKNGMCDLAVGDANSPSQEDLSSKQSDTKTFKDMKNHWSQKFVTKLVESKLIAGYPDGTIKPDLEISFCEVVVLLSKASGLEVKDNGESVDGVYIPYWAKEHYKAALENDLIDDYGTPSGKVTREEMLIMLVKAFKLSDDLSSDLSFNDIDKLPDLSKKAIGAAYKFKIVSGYPDNSFRPYKSVSRCEAFAMIANALDHYNNK